MSWVKAHDARAYYSVSAPTLRHWSKIDKIRSRELPSGRYEYWIEDEQDENPEKKTIIYSRVSSRKQEADRIGSADRHLRESEALAADLKRQERYLKDKYSKAVSYTDIGSGLNYKRKNFKAILQLLFKGLVKEVVVAHRDRFSRLSFDFFEWLFAEFGAKLTSLDDKEYEEGKGDELTDDLMEVITVFTARYYGSRKYKESKTKRK